MATKQKQGLRWAPPLQCEMKMRWARHLAQNEITIDQHRALPG